eukprot:gene15313-16890_t
MENNATILSGDLKFKAGLLDKWSTGFCQIFSGVFTVHQNEANTSAKPLYQFDSDNSWVSAKTQTSNGLFAINVKFSSDAPSKTFLFDALSADGLQEWLQGFVVGGWPSAIIDMKPRYRGKNVSNRTTTLRSERETARRIRNEAPIGHGTVDCDFDQHGSETARRQELEENIKIVNRKNVNLSDRGENPVGVKNRPENKFIDINGNTYHDRVTNLNPDSDEQSRLDSINKLHSKKDHVSPDLSSNLAKNKASEGVHRSASQPLFRKHETRFDASKIFFDPSSAENPGLETAELKPPINTSASANRLKTRKISLPAQHRDAALLESDETSVHSNNRFPSPRVSHGARFERRSRLNSAAEEQTGASVGLEKSKDATTDDSITDASSNSNSSPVFSLSDASTSLEATKNREQLRETRNEPLSDIFFGPANSSHQTAVMKIPLKGSSEHDHYLNLNADLPPQRKSSSVASEGVADLNADMDGDSNVFTSNPQHHTNHHHASSYLESGYCSKESLTTSENLDSPKSTSISLSELKIDDDGIEETIAKESTCKERGTPVQGIFAGDSENINNINSDNINNNINNSSDEKDVKIDGENGVLKEKTQLEANKMTPKLARPTMMKMEKRSSMSQLLSQIKEKLPGRKTKSNRKSIKRGPLNIENPESVQYKTNESWQERWISFSGNCLLLFKDAMFKSPDLALDVGGCTLMDVPTEPEPSVKLIEKNGKEHSFAATSVDSFDEFVNYLKGIAGSSTNNTDSIIDTDNPNLDDLDGTDPEDLQNAIVPYSEGEHHHLEVTDESKQNIKQTSLDSGTDGDISCFETSDASNTGIQAIAADRKEKIERRRKASILMQTKSGYVDVITGESIIPEGSPLQQKPRHKKVSYAESSPRAIIRDNVASTAHSLDLMKSEPSLYTSREHPKVEGPKKMKTNRNSVPDFRRQMLQQRSSCLEEVLKLREAHENNKYPGKGESGAERNRSMTWSIPKPKQQSASSEHEANESYGNHHNHSSQSWDVGMASKSAVVCELHKRSPNDGWDGFNNSGNNVSIGNGGCCHGEGGEEEDLKRQTLLMKRRNSLRLRKEVVGKKVKQIRETLEKGRKDMDSNETLNFEKNLVTLEENLSEINDELERLNGNITLPPVNDNVKDGKKSTKQQLFSKLKSTHKSSQKQLLTKENVDTLLTSPGLSPRMRKRSFNLKVIGSTLKRNSEIGETNSNRASMSSMESGNDVIFDPMMDLSGDTAEDCGQDRGAGPFSPTMSEVDEVGGPRSGSQTDGCEGGIIKEALFEIEEFEKFACQMAAKSFTECIDV